MRCKAMLWTLSLVISMLLGSVSLVAAQGVGGQPAGLTVVGNGQANAVIIVEDGADAHTMMAAETLVEYVEKSTAATLPIVTVSEYEQAEQGFAGQTLIYVGDSASHYHGNLWHRLKSLDDQGFIILPDENTVSIVGPSIWGTLHGVYDFLERYVGVRWLMLGPGGEDVPEQTDIVVARDIVWEQPAFSFRRLSPFSGADPVNPSSGGWVQNLWAQRNRLQGAYNNDISFHHNLHALFPPAKYGESNPEFYPGGIPPVPGETQKWQPCFTAEGSVEAAIAGIIEFFDNNPGVKSYSLGVNDIGGYCETNPSHPHYPGKRNSIGLVDMSDIYYAWVNDVIEGVLEVHPDKWFGLLAYQEVMDPPSFPLHPRAIPFVTKDRMAWVDDEIRREGHQQMDDWNAVASQVGWYDYMYGFIYYVPRVFPHLMAETMRYAKENNVIGYYTEMQYHAGDGPKAWLFSKLLWDPYEDVDALLAEWYERTVGPEAADDLAAFYDLWERFWMEDVPSSAWFQGGKRSTYLPFPSATYLAVVKQEDIEEGIRLLDSVVEKAQTDAQKHRANMIRRAFDFHIASALSYPREIQLPYDEASALDFLENFVDTYYERLRLAGERYDLVDEFRQVDDPNLRVRFSSRLWDYWWTHWDGWNPAEILAIVNYVMAYEPEGGPLTQRIEQLKDSQLPHERNLGYFVQLATGAVIDADSLTRNSSFENGLASWMLQPDSVGSVQQDVSRAYTGSASLRLSDAQQAGLTQRIPVHPGLIAAQVHYYTPSGTQDGIIQLEIRGKNGRGDEVTRLQSTPVPLASTAGQWSSVELIGALPALVPTERTELVSFDFIEPVITDKVRFYSEEAVDPQYGFLRLRELLVYGKQVGSGDDGPLENVVLNKPIIASSEFGVYTPDRAVDGNWMDRPSRWLTAHNASAPHWLEIDLQGTYQLEGADVWSGNEAGSNAHVLTDFKLQYWTGEEWADIPGGVLNDRVVQGEVTVLITGADNVDVYVDDFVVFQDVPLGTDVTLPDGSQRRLSNVAIGKPVEASSVFNQNVASRAVDGVWNDRASRWLTNRNAEPPHWLEIDLLGTFRLESAEVWTGNEPGSANPFAVSGFRLQQWNGHAWVDIPGASVDNNQSEYVRFDFSQPIVTDKVRFYTEVRDDGFIRVREIALYGVYEGDN